MCGRFSLSTPVQTLADIFDVKEKAALPPRYNIAPTDPVIAVRVPTESAERELALLRWGFVPSWAKEIGVGNRMINARSETVATSPAFRAAFRRRRCLIPADGFYEWQRQERRKQPFFLRMRDEQPFAFAGLWEIWEGGDGEVIESCTILTTEPSELVREVHDRMPVILEPKNYELWLDPAMQEPERLQPLLRPYAAKKMVAMPVSQMVNNPKNDGPELIVPQHAQERAAMLIHAHPLAATGDDLRAGRVELGDYLNRLCDWIDALEPQLQALLPEPGRRARLLEEASSLQASYPDPERRPPLYGVPIGVKDIFHVDGFPTRAGSRVPPDVLAGPQAGCVTALLDAGALILGKTVTAEFAFLAPGPTGNPHNLAHTPGGSSSGSAAAVAAGFCPLALGTQTVGSVIRPAAFCGIVGFKPTYGRINTSGLLFSAPSLDTIGIFTQDAEGAMEAASLLCSEWNPPARSSRPVLGVPDGPYLQQASPEGLAGFEKQLRRLQAAGFELRRVPAFEDFEAIRTRHHRLVAGEMAQVHAEWFAGHAGLYRAPTAELIRDGQQIEESELIAARAGRAELRTELAKLMDGAGIDLWVAPAAPGPAPHGLDSTGNSAMNLPWTHAGMPALTLPAGYSSDGLPLGFQCVAAAGKDEHLLLWAPGLERSLAVRPTD